MSIKLEILKYLQISNNSTLNLLYIQKLLNIHTKYQIEDIENFYYSYSYVTKDINISGKLGTSINYILMNNSDLLRISSDDFLIKILSDNTEDIILSDEIELRLVIIINSLKSYNPCLLKYINNYKSKLDITKLSVRHVKNSVSYYMKYSGYDINIHKQIILKSQNTIYKKELIEYINTQGCINITIFYNSLINNINNLYYINNVDVLECRRNFCYKHFMGYLKNNKLLQKYFIKEKSLEVICKFPEIISIHDLIKLLKEKDKLKHSGILYLLDDEEILLIFYLIKDRYNESDNKLITEHLVKYIDLFRDFIYQNNLNFKDLSKNIFDLSEDNEIQKDDNYIENCKNLFNNSQKDIKIQNVINNSQKDDNYIKSCKNLFNSQKDDYNVENVINKSQKDNNKSVNSNSFDNFSLIDNEECIKHKKIKFDIPIYNCEILCNIFQTNKDHLIEIILDNRIKIEEIFNFLDKICYKYDFKFIYEILLEIVNIHGKIIVQRIQLYLIDILEEGFFEESYFDMIKNIYNKLLPYSTNIKTKKNNDTIIILLSRYCKHFNKELYLGNIK